MSYSYGAFGKTSTKVTTYTKNSYTYNGENVDLIPGVPDLQYLRARYYDPNMGRFMQQDTLFGELNQPLTQNLYIYCLNNGVNLRDPSGNSSVADLQAQYDRAQRAGAGQSVLDGIKSAMESKRKAESKPKPKPNPTTKPPKKPDWGDTSNPYNPVNNPNSAGSILSGADGYWGNNGGGSSGSSGGGGYAPTQEDAMREAEAAAKNKKYAEEYRKKIESLIGGNKSWDRGTILLFNPNQIYNQFDYENPLKKIGCSITALAMGESYMLGVSRPPVTYDVTGKPNTKPYFISGAGLSGWGDNVSQYTPFLSEKDAYNTMASEIKKDRPVIVQVHGSNTGNLGATHFVLAIGAKEQGSGTNGQYQRDDFIIMDTFAKTSKYNNGEPQLDQLKMLSYRENQKNTPEQIRIFTFGKMDGMTSNSNRRSIIL